jgi:hypothetical protein
MTVTAIRDRLMTYLSTAEDKEVREIYSLLKGHVHLEDVTESFSQEQLAIINQRKKELTSGMDKGIDRVTLHNNVKAARTAFS